MAQKRVVFGIYGRKVDKLEQLDTTEKSAKSAKRHNARRPTLRVCTAPEFGVDRLVLLCSRSTKGPAKAFAQEVQAATKDRTQVDLRVIRGDPFDYGEAVRALAAFVRDYEKREGFHLENTDYFVHLGAGSMFQLTALFLLVRSRELPAQLLFARFDEKDQPLEHALVDLEDQSYGVLDRKRERQAEAAAEASLKGNLKTDSPVFNKVVKRIRHVAERSTDPILLGGKTGVGKTFVAEHIHEIRRSTRPALLSGKFVPLNCAGLRGHLVQSTLFGHVKGAFTGADTDREGALAAANQGLLFLDEIGELDLQTQALLLKALDERRFNPLGSDERVKSNFQLVSATNRDLIEEVNAGSFRRDLYARISTWTFVIPDLRDRHEDFEPLVERFLGDWHEERGRRARLTVAGKRRFLELAGSPESPWTWNLRDLQRLVRRLATLAQKGQITSRLVEEEFENLRGEWRRVRSDASATGGSFEADRQLLVERLGPVPVEGLEPVEIPTYAHILRVCSESPTQAEAGRRLYTSQNPSDRLRKALKKVGSSFKKLRTVASPYT